MVTFSCSTSPYLIYKNNLQLNGEVLREINQNSTQTYGILYIYMLPTVNSNNGTSYLANTTCQIIRGGFSELYCTIYRNLLY